MIKHIIYDKHQTQIYVYTDAISIQFKQLVLEVGFIFIFQVFLHQKIILKIAFLKIVQDQLEERVISQHHSHQILKSTIVLFSKTLQVHKEDHYIFSNHNLRSIKVILITI